VKLRIDLARIAAKAKSTASKLCFERGLSGLRFGPVSDPSSHWNGYFDPLMKLSSVGSAGAGSAGVLKQ
jgi:hypothetical protein